MQEEIELARQPFIRVANHPMVRKTDGVAPGRGWPGTDMVKIGSGRAVSRRRQT
jgi:hypothetical protein